MVFHRNCFSVLWNFVKALGDPVRVNAVIEGTQPIGKNIRDCVREVRS
jgi:hypothetical protein